MSTITPDTFEMAAGSWWLRTGRVIGQQLAWLAGWLSIIALSLLGLGMLAAALQAQRDEARASDLALVVTTTLPAEGLAERVFDLHRRGLAPYILVAGTGGEGLRTQLIERGVREEVVILVADEAVGTAGMQALVRSAQTNAARSVLVVAPPDALLTSVKMAQDYGLRAYAAPLSGRPDARTLLQASFNYWQYVLAF